MAGSKPDQVGGLAVGFGFGEFTPPRKHHLDRQVWLSDQSCRLIGCGPTDPCRNIPVGSSGSNPASGIASGSPCEAASRIGCYCPGSACSLKYSQASTTVPSGNSHIGSGPETTPPCSSQNTAAGLARPAPLSSPDDWR